MITLYLLQELFILCLNIRGLILLGWMFIMNGLMVGGILN
jgi:hypothetical protein